MKDTTVTIYDVAREAQVSMATVSRVVNGNQNVKKVTRDRVLEVIERLGYRPNAVARGLASKKTTTVGVVIPDITNNYFATLAKGINDVAGMYDYNIILANSDGDDEREVQVIHTLFSKQVDGIVFMGNHLSDLVREEFKKNGVPVVLAGTIDEQQAFASVNIDYEQAAFEAVDHLLANHDQVAFVSGTMNDAINQVKLSGYKRALEAKGLAYDESLVFETGYHYETALAFSKNLKESKAHAAYVTRDDIAVGLLNGLLDHGLKIPVEFELLTTNNSEITKYTRPSLSTVGQPLYDIGAVAMRLLTKLMRKESIDESEVKLAHSLVFRGSTS